MGFAAPSADPAHRDFEAGRGGAMLVMGLLQFTAGLGVTGVGLGLDMLGLAGVPATFGISAAVLVPGSSAIALGAALSFQGAGNATFGYNILLMSRGLGQGGNGAGAGGNSSTTNNSRPGKELPWSSKSVREANEALDRGAESVRVASRSEAEELFLRRFQGYGYRNVTGWSPKESKNFFQRKAGTYHWDEGLNAYPHDGNHLQVHALGGQVIRIYFP